MLKMKVMSLFHTPICATRLKAKKQDLKNDQPRRFIRSLPAHESVGRVVPVFGLTAQALAPWSAFSFPSPTVRGGSYP